MGRPRSLKHLNHCIFRLVLVETPVYFAASLVSSTARPLYSPHLAQARWGSFFSWQFGHSDKPVAVRKSWERRRAVRRVEWRLFGFGMMQFLSCSSPSRPHGFWTALRRGRNTKTFILRTLSGCVALKAPPSGGPMDPHRRSNPGYCGSDRSAGKVLCSQACTAS